MTDHRARYRPTQFARAITSSVDFTYLDYARNFGRVPERLGEMLASAPAYDALRLARAHMESEPPLPWGGPRLHTRTFGDLTSAPEALEGLVAAVDGTDPLPFRAFGTGHVQCVGVASASMTRQPTQDAHCISTHQLLDLDAQGGDVIEQGRRFARGFNAPAYRHYWEIEHAISLEQERFVFIDGPVLNEWLLSQPIAVGLYERLFSSKIVMGIIKDVHQSQRLDMFGRVLQPGEVYIDRTVAENMQEETAERDEDGLPPQRRTQGRVIESLRSLTSHVWRGVYRPGYKSIGFEVHEDHLDDMLRIAAGTAHMEAIGHEIPYLLALVDAQVRQLFNYQFMDQRVQQIVLQTSPHDALEETDERDLRG